MRKHTYEIPPTVIGIDRRRGQRQRQNGRGARKAPPLVPRDVVAIVVLLPHRQSDLEDHPRPVRQIQEEGRRSGGGGALSHPDSPDETPVARLGGLRVANRTSIDSDDEDEWSQDALRQLNLNNRQ